MTCAYEKNGIASVYGVHQSYEDTDVGEAIAASIREEDERSIAASVEEAAIMEAIAKVEEVEAVEAAEMAEAEEAACSCVARRPERIPARGSLMVIANIVSILGMFTMDDRRELAQEGIERIKRDSGGRKNIVDVWGDGNCIIYSMIAYLFHTCSRDRFFTVLFPFCSDHIREMLLDVPEHVLGDHETMFQIAQNVRDVVVRCWYFKGNCDYHMNSRAIDGYAVKMVMNLFGVDSMEVFSVLPDHGENHVERYAITHDDVNIRHDINPSETELRPDIKDKWHVTLYSVISFDHCGALLP